MKHEYPGLNLEFEKHYDAKRTSINIYGFWVFMMSDLITFGLFFATYATMKNPMGMAMGPDPAELFNLASIGWQTAILLASSLSAGLAALAFVFDQKRSRVMFWLFFTAILGIIFLFLEIQDFVEMWEKGGTPMRSGWLSSLYALVGLHGLHIFFGVIWIFTLIGLMSRIGSYQRFRSRLLVFVLYWHFLDLIWIGIYSVVFLGGYL